MTDAAEDQVEVGVMITKRNQVRGGGGGRETNHKRR